MRRRFVLAAVLCGMIALPARADTGDAPPSFDAARPAVGEWIGEVSWSEGLVTYTWTINPDSTFTSGRYGRGHDGGGTWSSRGEYLTLKYEDGFHYEGVLRGNDYSGTAYRAGGDALGTFSMSRDVKRN